MNLFFIEKYIQKLTKEDIYNYAQKENITLTTQELNTIYNYIIIHHKSFLRNKNIRPTLLKELKSQVSIPVSNKLDELYYLYQDKI